MFLNGVNFGNVFCASGARNLDGSGWPFHKHLPFIDFLGMTTVLKTTTLEKRVGNMVLLEDGKTPAHQFPDCIRVYWRKGIALNAVGLSGPGLRFILDSGWWQNQRRPFMVSLMAVGSTPKERLDEFRGMVDVIGTRLGEFHAPFAIQVNFSCPNVTVKERNGLVDEVASSLDVLSALARPLLPKFNVLLDATSAVAMSGHDKFRGLVYSNTVGWRDLHVAGISRKRLFGTDTSPLLKYGGGALSGAPLHKPVCRGIRKLRDAGFTKPIIGEGGILGSSDARRVITAGADAIGLGSIFLLRPWRVNATVRRANALFRDRERLG